MVLLQFVGAKTGASSVTMSVSSVTQRGSDRLLVATLGRRVLVGCSAGKKVAEPTASGLAID
jgi:hypothetical protein